MDGDFIQSRGLRAILSCQICNKLNITIIGNLAARNIPILIVANKIDLKKADVKKIESAFPEYFQTTGPQMVAGTAPIIRYMMDQIGPTATTEFRVYYYNVLTWCVEGLRHFVSGGQGMEEFVGAKDPADVLH